MFVPGIAITKGSKTLSRTKSGRYFMREANSGKLTRWMNVIGMEARRQMRRPFQGAIALTCEFFFVKPKSVRRRSLPHVKPDLDKLVRAVNDALESIAFDNDSRVTTIRAIKRYSDKPGVRITIEKDK